MSDQDNGARALAERLHALTVEFGYECDHHADELGVSLECEDSAAAILANGAVFLPDAAELERLRRIEAAAGTANTILAKYVKWHRVAGLLPSIGRAAEVQEALRAVLASEGSAGTRTVWPRWECSTCRKTAVSCSTYRCCPDCDHDPIRATEGSARDGG